MGPDDLQTFIAQLEAQGELKRIKVPVGPDLEAAAIIDRVCKTADGGHALLFEAIDGADMPLAANLYGSQRRVALALGVETLENLAVRLRRDLKATGQTSSESALRELTEDRQWQPLDDVSPACFAEKVNAKGLLALPALKAWPLDGGRYLTLGQIFTVHPETKMANCGMYRVQVVDSGTALLRCHPGSGGGEHIAAWHALGQPAPVAIALGGPPALTLVAGMPLPMNVDEVTVAGYLSGRPLSMASCHSNHLRVPAAAEVVIEGHVRPGEFQLEGPFGNHTGRYAPASSAPVLRVDRVWARTGAICPATLVGPPPMENAHLALAARELLLPLLQHDHPWVKSVHLPVEGIYHRAALVAISGCESPLEEISRTLWQSALLRNSRLLVLLDHKVHAHEFSHAYWRVINAAHWEESVLIDADRMIIDARSPVPDVEVSTDMATLKHITVRWPEYGLE